MLVLYSFNSLRQNYITNCDTKIVTQKLLISLLGREKGCRKEGRSQPARKATVRGKRDLTSKVSSSRAAHSCTSGGQGGFWLQFCPLYKSHDISQISRIPKGRAGKFFLIFYHLLVLGWETKATYRASLWGAWTVHFLVTVFFFFSSVTHLFYYTDKVFSYQRGALLMIFLLGSIRTKSPVPLKLGGPTTTQTITFAKTIFFSLSTMKLCMSGIKLLKGFWMWERWDILKNSHYKQCLFFLLIKE